MCGITGAVWTDPAHAISEDELRRMTASLRHRGPDDDGSYRQERLVRPPLDPLPGVALGFRRLSIIDIDGGRQPMSNEDGTVWVVFNGEIYNYRELRRRLEGSGHRFQTESDTETIVHLYEDLGPDCFSHLNGMFAIAIWDANHRRLVLGRDRLGQKPLFYRHDNDRLLFASELKSLREVDGLRWTIDPGAVDEYLTYQYVPHPNTIFREASKLPPGARAVFSDGRLDVSAYWRPDWSVSVATTREEASERLRELLTSSVQMRMRSDVPLGAFLSGGVDSSLIVALMQQHSETPIQTFSIGFPIKAYDESRYAQLVARHLGTDHHDFQVTPEGGDMIAKLVEHFDEPFADSSAIPTWIVSQQAREHVTVSLSGDGGDELFAGYPRYKAVAWGGALDGWPSVRDLLTLPAWRWLPGGSRQKSILRRARRFSDALAMEPRRRYLEWVAIFNEERRGQLYRDEFLERLPESDPAGFLMQAWRRAGRRNPVTCASLADLTTYLPCDLMTKVDITSMAHGLEVRQPFLDHRLVEWAATLPLKWKYRWGRGKRLLRDTFGKLLPATIWNRRKMGFGVPLDHWFRNELRETAGDLLLSENAQLLEFFRPAAVRRLFDDHQARRFDHSYRLWSLLMFEQWLRRWSDVKGVNRSSAPAGDGRIATVEGA